jgi:hypothetical protein
VLDGAFMTQHVIDTAGCYAKSKVASVLARGARREAKRSSKDRVELFRASLRRETERQRKEQKAGGVHHMLECRVLVPVGAEEDESVRAAGASILPVRVIAYRYVHVSEKTENPSRAIRLAGEIEDRRRAAGVVPLLSPDCDLVPLNGADVSELGEFDAVVKRPKALARLKKRKSHVFHDAFAFHPFLLALHLRAESERRTLLAEVKAVAASVRSTGREARLKQVATFEDSVSKDLAATKRELEAARATQKGVVTSLVRAKKKRLPQAAGVQPPPRRTA